MMRSHFIRPGDPAPLGATPVAGGVNFSVYSPDASMVELLLFDNGDYQAIRLDPRQHRTGDYWHAFVVGAGHGQRYAYRVDGPFLPSRGQRFDRSKVLLDPYARAIDGIEGYDRVAACRPGDNRDAALTGIVVDTGHYDWEGDRLLRRPWSDTIIYEMHVKGFTAHSSASPEVPEAQRGTFAGMIHKIPYLVDLGITAVELLPIFHFDPQDSPVGKPNYWGYAPLSFFAPHSPYSAAVVATGESMRAIDEFRDLVKALHRAGIEVILDVVYNHTAEGNRRGPSLSFRGFADRAYYLLDPKTGAYANYSGTGNTFNCNHAVARRLIVDSLIYWVREMHVDGFRFDLASILARDESGRPTPNPPILWAIESEPSLAGVKLIAEAWDAGGLYQVGIFPGRHWQEWNGPFRDDVRRFVRGDDGMVGKLATRLLASPDLYAHKKRAPSHSIHFVTCHDGFTLNDLVSYNAKHNAANGEDGRDGMDENYSWNCGVEGPSDDPEIEALRLRQIKNLFALNLLAMGTPMLSMGDEVRRTQLGNNNAYCQDNALSWFDWRQVDTQGALLRFVRRMVQLRKAVDEVSRGRDKQLSLSELLAKSTLQWHGVKLHAPDWSAQSRAIAAETEIQGGAYRLFLIFNAFYKPLSFELPDAGHEPWLRLMDTGLESPDDITSPRHAAAIVETHYQAPGRSVVLLLCQHGAVKSEGGDESAIPLAVLLD